jgi:hypothetical protein
MSDKLQIMFEQQVQFMKLLQEKRDFPEFPVDLSQKKDQKFVKSLIYDCVDELWESQRMLKNTKSHRITDFPDLDREGYIEELADALHYYFEVVAASGVTLDELFESYIRKGEINVERIKNNY